MNRMCLIILAVLFASVDAWSGAMQTAVTVYEKDSCTSPPASMFITRELSCTPLPVDAAHTCVNNGFANIITNCTEYLSGRDTNGLISSAFRGEQEHPYLNVEYYDPSARSCGDYNGMINVSLHLLDEKCHVNADGTESSKITLGRFLTFTEYSDPKCSDVSMVTDVPYGESWDRACVNNETRYIYSGPKPPMSVVTVFDDNLCSKPVKLTMTQGFICDAERNPMKKTCRQDGTSHYSISSCTDDYKEYVAKIFSDGTPYVMVEEFTNNWCGEVATVTVYTMDNVCHTNSDDTTSFRAILTPDGSAVVTTYADPKCESVLSSTDITKRSGICMAKWNCGDGYVHGCAKRYSVGGSLGELLANGQMTGVVMYDSDSCSSPATSVIFTRELTCTPQAREPNTHSSRWYDSDWNNTDSSMPRPICEVNGIISTITDCTYYYSGWDTSSLLRQAFGDGMYLLVEQYDPTARYCGDDQAIVSITAHILDENCHVKRDGTASSKISLGRTLTITEYADSQCQDVVTIEEVPYGEPYSRPCANNATRYYYMGPKPKMTVVAVYDDSSCSNTPIKMTITQGFVCDAEKNPSTTSCVSDGNSHYTKSTCTDDYNKLASDMFNDTKHVVVEEFTSDWCGNVDTVTVYIMDNKCHSNIDDVTSFRATFTQDGSTTLTTFSDTNCETILSSMDYTKRSQMCLHQKCDNDLFYGCSKRFSVGGDWGEDRLLDSEMTALALYSDGSCSPPVATIIMSRELSCALQSNPQTKSGVYSSGFNGYELPCESSSIGSTWTDCLRWYVPYSFSQAFQNYPYLLVEEYDPTAKYCGDIDGLLNSTAYILDENCHVNRDGTTSSKFSLGHTLTITEYSDSKCNDVLTTTVVPYGDAYDRACANNATRYVYVGSLSPMSAIAVYDSSSCSEAPVTISMIQGFVCDAQKNPSKMDCRLDEHSQYSISSCTSDYTEHASALFGKNTPYVLVEEFTNSRCSQAATVTAYVMDGDCHSNTDGLTSFRAILTSDRSAIINTYVDANCEFIRTSMDFTKRSRMCIPQQQCGDGYVQGCAKRYSAVNLGTSSTPSSGKSSKAAVVVYDDNKCASHPVQLVITEQSDCKFLENEACRQDFKTKHTRYYTRECVDNIVAYVESKFGDAPNLIMETYTEGTKCRSQQGVVVYNADSSCHLGMNKLYFRVSFGVENTVTLATFPDALCSDLNAVYVTVGRKYINTDVCYDGKARFYTNMDVVTKPHIPKPTTDEYKTREEIMFPAWLWDPVPRRIFQSA